MTTPLVAIGCPVRNRAWVLPEYIAALDVIEYGPTQGIFLVDNSEDETDQILRDFAAGGRAVTVSVAPADDAPGHRRGEYGRNGYAHLANVRNLFLEMFLATDADYLLSVDSDVIVPPDILRHLLPLADDRTVVGAAISNIAGRPLDGRTCGNFLVSQDGLLVHPPTYPLSGVLEVDVAGACCLIPRLVLEAGVRYGPHRQGEDIPFCAAAKERGCRILVTFDVRPEHRMVEAGG